MKTHKHKEPINVFWLYNEMKEFSSRFPCYLKGWLMMIVRDSKSQSNSVKIGSRRMLGFKLPRFLSILVSWTFLKKVASLKGNLENLRWFEFRVWTGIPERLLVDQRRKYRQKLNVKIWMYYTLLLVLDNIGRVWNGSVRVECFQAARDIKISWKWCGWDGCKQLVWTLKLHPTNKKQSSSAHAVLSTGQMCWRRRWWQLIPVGYCPILVHLHPLLCVVD